MRRLTARRAGVVGLGASGEAAALALQAEGLDVFVTESTSTSAVVERAAALEARGIAVETGGHGDEILSCEIVVTSPGIPPGAPVLRAVDAAGIPIWSEIELAYRLASCDFLAVTGTNGKTTTTALLAAMLGAAGIPSLAAGNIGLPLVEAVRRLGPGGAVAAEVSSFQLAGIDTFRARVAVILNVAEDHTDWHGSFDSYVAAKARIVENQKPEDVVVFNAEDASAASIGSRSEAHRKVGFSALRRIDGGLWADRELHWRDRTFAPASLVHLPGSSGIEDSLAAAGAALEYGLSDAAVAAGMARFRPLRHRLEKIAVHDGITYIDDSKATNPHAALTAVRGLDNVALIAGGRSKGIDLSILASSVPPVIGVAALGESAAEIAAVFQDLVPVRVCASMDEAVRAARSLIRGEGSVLLAPGCASLDMYEGYAARGDDFARVVRDLIDTGGERRDDGGNP